jgi:hypothetical protein
MVLRSAVYPMQGMRLMICCVMAVKKMGMLRSVWKVKALTMKTETVTLTGKG